MTCFDNYLINLIFLFVTCQRGLQSKRYGSFYCGLGTRLKNRKVLRFELGNQNDIVLATLQRCGAAPHHSITESQPNLVQLWECQIFLRPMWQFDMFKFDIPKIQLQPTCQIFYLIMLSIYLKFWE